MHRNTFPEGLWVSCPERTEWGPMFAQLQVWRDGTFKMRVFARDPNQEIWGGVIVLAGHVNIDIHELVPDNEFALKDNRWEYIIHDDDMVVRHIYEDGLEETQMKRLE